MNEGHPALEHMFQIEELIEQEQAGSDSKDDEQVQPDPGDVSAEFADPDFSSNDREPRRCV